MSVLLDALKKAAEEKKRAEGGVVQTNEAPFQLETRSESSEQSPEADVLETDETNDSDNAPAFKFVDTKEVNAENATDETVAKIDTASDLPVFSLKESPEGHAGVSAGDSPENISIEKANTSESFTAEPLTTDLEFNDNTDEDIDIHQDLTSLIDSMGVDEQPSDKLKLSSQAKFNGENGLNLEQQSQPGISPIASEVDITNLPEEQDISSMDDSFNWSMDDLPAYSSSKSQPIADQTKTPSATKNTILISGGTSNPKVKKGLTTSSRIIVSLVVIFLFVGIGFYGMLYYQEQNDQLEFSMKKYNLTQMRFDPVKRSTEDSANSGIVNYESAANQKVANQKLISIDTSHEKMTAELVASNADVNNQKIPTQANTKISSDSYIESENKPNLVTPNPSNNIAKNKKASESNASYTKDRVSVGSEKKRSYSSQMPSRQGLDATQIVVKNSKSSNSLAYEAYAAGDFKKAKDLFNQSLNTDPNNKTALIGLGGVAVASGDLYSAVNFYQRVLDIEPNNLNAYEALANLSGRVPFNQNWETELFDMANTYPQSAVMQYALGNIYAKDQDWLAAQERYFNAYSLDSSNADYMVNLAVSFDHLGKYRLADQYYTKALGYSESSNVSFDKTQVRNRLISIRQLIVKGN